MSSTGTSTSGEEHANDFGASVIVLGFIAFLLFRSAFDRRLSSLIITIIVAGLYGTAVGTSLIPEEGISWSGHFFGFLGGFVAARLRYRTAPKIYPGEHPLAVLNMPRMME